MANIQTNFRKLPIIDIIIYEYFILNFTLRVLK